MDYMGRAYGEHKTIKNQNNVSLFLPSNTDASRL
jgi:hypothetical protein